MAGRCGVVDQLFLHGKALGIVVVVQVLLIDLGAFVGQEDCGGALGPLLLEALLEAPLQGLPGSNFIYPMVAQGADAAAQLLD